MLKLFAKTNPTPQGSLVELCQDGYRAVVGESHYQDALRATRAICRSGEEGRPTFDAALVPEPENQYDENAVAVYSPKGKLGYLSRADALGYNKVFADVARCGYRGGSCNAFLIGGEPDKPSYGVVLRLAVPKTCLTKLGS